VTGTDREPGGRIPRPGPSGLPVGDLLTTGTVSLDQPIPHSALAIGAHPDDIEFGCGATLAKWAAAGCRIHHLVLTDGSKGSWDAGADVRALVTTREAESRAAAAVLDGHPATDVDRDRVLFLDRIDGELENTVDERREVARIIRRLRPAALVGHDPWRRYRLHPDHRAAGFLTVDALVGARDPHFFPEMGLEPHRPEALLLFEADLPNHVEEVSEFESQKIEALLCHRSQFESTMGIPGDGDPRADGDSGRTSGAGYAAFAAKVRRQLAAHGALAERSSGEAFHRITEL
jgi:LmbE family N-acetylglucosaminyl deacetylase